MQLQICWQILESLSLVGVLGLVEGLEFGESESTICTLELVGVDL